MLAPVAHYVPTGLPSPSGNARKRARVWPPKPPAGSPLQLVTERTVKPIPSRHGPADRNPVDDARKRKRSGPAVGVQSSDHWPQAEAGVGHFPVPDRGANAMYQPSGPPAPFSMQPPYVGHNAFSGPTYQPPFYPQHAYGQQGWPPMNLNNAPPQWPVPNPYSQEEIDPFTGMRRGGYGNTSQY